VRCPGLLDYTPHRIRNAEDTQFARTSPAQRSSITTRAGVVRIAKGSAQVVKDDVVKGLLQYLDDIKQPQDLNAQRRFLCKLAHDSNV
jgi:hypothetical protein